ncbi:hypothetical protein DYB36_011857 [Aphanomyces astaci]|uniref:Nucleolar protein 11 n=1 Tax=Aphanomyces astaci TaxID=112090 RepID=A0A397AD53_APHAT|nr:hypothetical protein DYB36_011857 [Aphanomyces astaci]
MAAPLALSSAWTSRGDSRILGAHACSGPTPGLILVTTSDQVALLNTAKSTFQGNAAVVHSWEYRSGSAQALSLIAVQHPTKHDLFFGIRGKGKTEFVSWSSATERINDVPARTLPFSVHALLVNTHLDGCVVVGTNGAVSIVTDASISPLVVATKPASTTVVFVHLAHDNTHQLHLTLVFKAATSSTYTATSYTLSQDHDDSAPVTIASTGPRHDVSPPSATSTLVSTIVQDPHTLSLFWSTGEWQTVALHASPATAIKHVASLSVLPTTATTTISQEQGSNKKKRKVSAESNAVTYFAASVSNKSLVVGSPSSLSVWNSQYVVEMAKHSIVSSAPVLTNLLALVVLPQTSHIAYISERAVHVAVVPTAPATLASVLGKGASSQQPPLVLSTFVPSNPAEVTAVMSSLDLSTWQSTMLGENAAQVDVLATLTAPALTREEFLKTFYGYVYFKTKRKLRVAVLSPQFVVQVASRIVHSPELALWAELSLLLSTKHLCSRSIPSLVPTAMALKQFGLLEDCLVHLSDVDEVLAIRICKFILREASPSSVAAFQSQHAKGSTSGVTTASQFVEHFLSLVVALPKADVFLQTAMQAFTVPEVLALLACLKKWYRQRAAPDSLHHIVEWMGLLLDVHYTALVVESDSSPYIVTVLKDLQALLLSHVDACHHMADIHGELDQFLTSAHLPQTAATLPDYAVDVLLL